MVALKENKNDKKAGVCGASQSLFLWSTSCLYCNDRLQLERPPGRPAPPIAPIEPGALEQLRNVACGGRPGEDASRGGCSDAPRSLERLKARLISTDLTPAVRHWAWRCTQSGQPGAPSSPAPAWPVPGYRPGSAAAATPPDPLPVRPASAGAFVGSAPAWRAAPPAAAAAAPTAAWGAPFQPQPPQLPQPQPSAYLPEPPAPRSWTPSKLSTGACGGRRGLHEQQLMLARLDTRVPAAASHRRVLASRCMRRHGHAAHEPS